MQLPGISFQSWANERLPEMLWACLLISVFPREAALGAFREIAALGMRYRDDAEDSVAKGWTLNLSSLPHQAPEMVKSIVKTSARHPLGYAALRPLLLLNSLPGREVWQEALSVQPTEHDWRTLGQAVMVTFGHQTQEATDVRWVSLLFKIALGEIRFPEQLRERVDEIIHYPNKGDMRSVRPFIRSSEITINITEIDGKNPPETWPDEFWKECLERTTCLPAPLKRMDSTERDTNALASELLEVRSALRDHWQVTLTTTGVDVRHDAVFGLGFFALSCLLEMISGHNSFGISGRLLLRSLTECRISLAYLIRCGNDDMWAKFRSYGTGQAKLALLKLEEMSEDKPNFVRKETLEALANEDFFQEYVEIDLGHWCGKDLRKMADESGTKDDYDKFYGWASGFVHGQWGALRDSNMTHCLNPLHRFHRVPLPSHRMMEDALPDALVLVNSLLDDIDRIFPCFKFRIQASDAN